MIQRVELEQYLDTLLQPQLFNDYCPNGLQVQGKAEVRKIVTGVTASLDCIQAAAEAGADALLVHHGFFWRGESYPVVGHKYERIRALMEAGISLFGYHLPLDCHEELGNNVQLAQRIGIHRTGPLHVDRSNQPGDIGEFEQSLSIERLKDRLVKALGQEPLIIPGHSIRSEVKTNSDIQRVAWCTGAAQSYFEKAIAAGVDAFITGEISEPMVHLARESGVTYVAAGHHATERYGILALGLHLQDQFGIEAEFIDIDSPV